MGVYPKILAKSTKSWTAQVAVIPVGGCFPKGPYAHEVSLIGRPPGSCVRRITNVLGSLDFAKMARADAEGNLRKSIDSLPQDPDPVAIFRLSMTLDMPRKYPEALNYRAVELTKGGYECGPRCAQ